MKKLFAIFGLRNEYFRPFINIVNVHKRPESILQPALIFNHHNESDEFSAIFMFSGRYILESCRYKKFKQV
jgi:hypothetical protein